MTSARVVGDKRGVAAVEFALLLPVFLLITGALIDIGLMMWTQLGIEHAVEAGARYASLYTASHPPAPCPVAANVQSYTATQAYGLGLPASTFTYTTATCGFQVKASYSYQFIGDGFPQMTMTLSATSCIPRPPMGYTCS